MGPTGGSRRTATSGDPNRARDHLANERTFLAWLRTGVAIIVFGFAIGRFAIAMRHKQVRYCPLEPAGQFPLQAQTCLLHAWCLKVQKKQMPPPRWSHTAATPPVSCTTGPPGQFTAEHSDKRAEPDVGRKPYYREK